jgi:hypothetical protein
VAERFHRLDAAYKTWLEQNPKGYVLNTSQDAGDYQYPKLHRASCKSLGKLDTATDDVACVCSRDQGELEAVANSEYGRVTYCGVCRP